MSWKTIWAQTLRLALWREGFHRTSASIGSGDRYIEDSGEEPLIYFTSTNRNQATNTFDLSGRDNSRFKFKCFFVEPATRGVSITDSRTPVGG